MAESIPYTQLSKGSLLIASPDIENGIYFRGVVILCEHSPVGSFGLLVNKNLNVELPEDVINPKEFSNPNVQILAGGMIQPNQLMVLHGSEEIPNQTLNLCEGIFLGGDLQFLQETVANASGPPVRLCFGYCGWGAGQLEREFLNGDWFLHPGKAKYVFEIPPDKIWQSILRDMGGKYATLSMIPEDLSLN